MNRDRDLETETNESIGEDDVELFKEELDELRELDSPEHPKRKDTYPNKNLSKEEVQGRA